MLQDELNSKGKEILRLQSELDPLRRAMGEYAKQLSETNKNEENMIDK